MLKVNFANRNSQFTIEYYLIDNNLDEAFVFMTHVCTFFVSFATVLQLQLASLCNYGGKKITNDRSNSLIFL